MLAGDLKGFNIYLLENCHIVLFVLLITPTEAYVYISLKLQGRVNQFKLMIFVYMKNV